jgi:hypothetical protein
MYPKNTWANDRDVNSEYQTEDRLNTKGKRKELGYLNIPQPLIKFDFVNSERDSPPPIISLA